jgi:para-aminobenzoate synthetase/4-amino-4-deoxychorismate lyase
MSIETAISGEPRPEFALIESLGWRRGGYTFLPQHLTRLSSSAAHYGFCNNTDGIVNALRKLELGLDDRENYKVRVQLEPCGDFHLNHEVLHQDHEIGSITISSLRTSSTDTFLRHKTTHRELYDCVFSKARTRGYREVLFLNEKGELTECANHNLFLLTHDGCLLTPDVNCGLLPGIYRNVVLETVLHTASAVLHLEDLRAAHQIYVCNSVRGIQHVQWSGEFLPDT